MLSETLSAILPFMDPINRRIYEFMATGVFFERKTVVDRVLEAVREDGHEISKSALAERVGHKYKDYQDGIWVLEVKALVRLERSTLEYYATLEKRFKFKWLRVIVAMSDDEILGFNSLTDPSEMWWYLADVADGNSFKPPKWFEVRKAPEMA
jgi:hypothetical protein